MVLLTYLYALPIALTISGKSPPLLERRLVPNFECPTRTRVGRRVRLRLRAAIAFLVIFSRLRAILLYSITFQQFRLDRFLRFP